MPRHTFVQQFKLHDVNGRIDYISNPKRQEHLYAFCSSVEPIIWDLLARQNQMDFRKSGAKGACIEARELVIALPESLQDMDPDQLLRKFINTFQDNYPVPCAAALHHNKSMTNYHIHLIFSERELLDEVQIKTATRAMFYNEEKKHVRTKKEILDADGKVRPGCIIIPKGEAYEITGFSSKDKHFKSKAFTRDVKDLFTALINEHVKDESEKLQVFDPGGIYLATKKIGKNNPLEDTIRADNAARQEWNAAVDEALVTGISETEILRIKKESVVKPVSESIKQHGFNPDALREILTAAIQRLLDFIRGIRVPKFSSIATDLRLFDDMQRTRKTLAAIVQQIRRIDTAVMKIDKQLEGYSGLNGKLRHSKKQELLSEKEELRSRRSVLSGKIGDVVRQEGYKDVKCFMAAYHECEIAITEYRQWIKEHPEDKAGAEMSAIEKLRHYQEQARIGKKSPDRPRDSLSRE